MSEATVRGYINTIVEGVTNIGLVHDYERWSNNQTTFLDYFKTLIGGSSVIRGWTITCAIATQEWLNEPQADGQGQIARTYTYKLRGYFGLDDSAETEKSAWVVVEAVMRALDESGILHGEDEMWTINPPSQLTIFEPRLFAGVLCHYAEITQQVTEVISL